MRRVGGVTLLAAGSLALIAPQANLGLTELRWIARYAFPGEALLGALLLGVAYLLLGKHAAPHAARRSPSSREK
jgi:hypothetical protein